MIPRRTHRRALEDVADLAGRAVNGVPLEREHVDDARILVEFARRVADNVRRFNDRKRAYSGDVSRAGG